MKRSILLKTFTFLLIVFNFGCDQITKDIVRKEIENRETIEVIGQNFILTKVENRGMALSLGSELPEIFHLVIIQFIPLVLIIGLTAFVFIRKLQMSILIGLCFIIGGGYGNLVDRIFYGSVTDFMYLEVGIVRTGIFNVADLSVTIGAIIIAVSSIRPTDKRKKIKLERTED